MRRGRMRRSRWRSASQGRASASGAAASRERAASRAGSRSAGASGRRDATVAAGRTTSGVTTVGAAGSECEAGSARARTMAGCAAAPWKDEGRRFPSARPGEESAGTPPRPPPHRRATLFDDPSRDSTHGSDPRCRASLERGIGRSGRGLEYWGGRSGQLQAQARALFPPSDARARRRGRLGLLLRLGAERGPAGGRAAAGRPPAGARRLPGAG